MDKLKGVGQLLALLGYAMAGNPKGPFLFMGAWVYEIR